METYTVGGTRIAEIEQTGPGLSSEQDALDVMGALYETEADYVAIPVTRFVPEFWQLRTRLLGLFVQKLVNYQQKVVFIGDLAAEIAASDALRDYVRESNRRKDVLFAADRKALAALLA